MDFTVGCSIEELRSKDSLGSLSVVNIENPLYPGYLAVDRRLDADYLRNSVPGRLILDGPYIDLNLGSPEPAIRSLARERTLSAMSYARNAGAEALIVQSTYLPFIGAEFYDRGWIEQSIESWRTVLRSGAPVQIALCNTFEFYPDSLLELAEAVDDSRIEIAFDIGHCLVWGKTGVVEWYRKVRSNCRYVYLHSNDGKGDQHGSIRCGLLHELEVLKSLRGELRPDSVLILKYFDKQTVVEDLRYLTEFFQ